jgi:hypothetical protein
MVAVEARMQRWFVPGNSGAGLRRFLVRSAAGGFAEEGAGCAAGEVAVAGRFAESAAVFGEKGDGEVARLGGGVGGATVGEFIGGGEEVADGFLRGPDDELGEFEFVCRGDFGEGLVGLEEVGEEFVVVDGEAVDVVVDGG